MTQIQLLWDYSENVPQRVCRGCGQTMFSPTPWRWLCPNCHSLYYYDFITGKWEYKRWK